MAHRETGAELALRFYDDLAEHYDMMTGRQNGVQRVRRPLEAFVSKTGIRSAVDTGCGTGWHAVALAQMGLRTAGIDLSPEMIDRARKLAAITGVDVRWHVGDLTQIHDLVGSGWDAVFCLGNTLPHLLKVAEVRRFARSASRTLNSGGFLAIQCLNYDLLRSRDERVVAITRHNQHEFIRFNDYLNRRVRFNLLRIEWTARGPRHKLSHTLLRPWTAQDLAHVLRGTGFQDIRVYSDLKLSPFDPSASRSFVLVAQKSALS